MYLIVCILQVELQGLITKKHNMEKNESESEEEQEPSQQKLPKLHPMQKIAMSKTRINGIGPLVPLTTNVARGNALLSRSTRGHGHGEGLGARDTENGGDVASLPPDAIIIRPLRFSEAKRQGHAHEIPRTP